MHSWWTDSSRAPYGTLLYHPGLLANARPPLVTRPRSVFWSWALGYRRDFSLASEFELPAAVEPRDCWTGWCCCLTNNLRTSGVFRDWCCWGSTCSLQPAETSWELCARKKGCSKDWTLVRRLGLGDCSGRWGGSTCSRHCYGDPTWAMSDCSPAQRSCWLKIRRRRTEVLPLSCSWTVFWREPCWSHPRGSCLSALSFWAASSRWGWPSCRFHCPQCTSTRALLWRHPPLRTPRWRIPGFQLGCIGRWTSWYRAEGPCRAWECELRRSPQTGQMLSEGSPSSSPARIHSPAFRPRGDGRMPAGYCR